MLSLLNLYAVALFSNWWAVVTGSAPLLFDQIVLRFLSKRWRTWADEGGPLRRRIEVGFLVVCVIAAGFLAWRDEYNLHQTDLAALHETQVKLAVASAQANERWQAIYGPNGYASRHGEARSGTALVSVVAKPPDQLAQLKTLIRRGRSVLTELETMTVATQPQSEQDKTAWQEDVITYLRKTYPDADANGGRVNHFNYETLQNNYYVYKPGEPDIVKTLDRKLVYGQVQYLRSILAGSK